ncbi:MAG: hypothetical protein HN542_05780 [Flavobacteriales bacterium]|nr:hypothetical protein [Flavobacteriales bacterium]NCG30919.1 hypothetical protein [Bacteroidota bacterium]MBT3964501.1 hypothetical protein [Flavobacteriales bacterium]MBT4705739.1 hypothetical protein [Flavobacteriales bacterium]MBT4931015.1 hypothetical protein [Flavobacteriales bacterium]
MKQFLPIGMLAAFIILLSSACSKGDDLIPNPSADDQDSLFDTIARVHFLISHSIHTPSAANGRSRRVYKYGEEMDLLSTDVYTSDEGGSSLYFLRTDEARYSLNRIEVGAMTYHLNENQLVYQIDHGIRTTEIGYDSLKRKITKRVFKNEKLESEHRYKWKGSLLSKDSAYYPDDLYTVAISRFTFKDENSPTINHGDLQLFGESNSREPTRNITDYYNEEGVLKYTTYAKYLFDIDGDSIVREQKFWNSIYVDSLSVFQTDIYSFREL